MKLETFREENLTKIGLVDLPSFRHGLNIVVDPGNLKLVEPNQVLQLKSEIGLKFTSEIREEIVGKFFSEGWNISEDDNSLYYHHLAHSDIRYISMSESAEIKIEVSDIVMSTLLFDVPPNCNVRIVLDISGSPIFFGDFVRVYCGEGSNVEFVTVQRLGSGNYVQERKSFCMQNSSIQWKEICIGSDYSKSNVVSFLKGRCSDSKIVSLFYGNRNQKYDLLTNSYHLAPESNSDIISKGVLDGSSKAVSRGLVYIGEMANDCNGFEKQDVLLLSKTSHANAIPNLEIQNHNVKCSHGSSVGHLDEEHIFYLMSRGLGRNESVRKIIEGYYNPVLSCLGDLKEDVYEYLMGVMND